MKLIKKYKNALPLAYIFLLIVGTLYTRQVLASNSVEVRTKQKDEKNITEIKPVKVYLDIGQVFSKKMDSSNTFLDLMENLCSDGLLKYEITEYTYGSRFEHINYVYPQDGYEWSLFIDNKKYDGELSGLALVDKTTYGLDITRIEEHQ